MKGISAPYRESGINQAAAAHIAWRKKRNNGWQYLAPAASSAAYGVLRAALSAWKTP